MTQHADIPDGYEVVGAEGGQTSFEALVGPILRKTGAPEGEAHWAFRVEQRHCNPYGMLHGGMLTTVADTMMGSLVFHAIGGAPCATIHLATDFIGAAKAGDWVEGRATLVRKGRAVAFVQA